MIDSICHTHTIWTSLFHSLSPKILHFRCMLPMTHMVSSNPCPHPHDHHKQRWHSSHCWHCLSYSYHREQMKPHLCEVLLLDANRSCKYLRTSCNQVAAFHLCEFYDVYSNSCFVWTACYNLDKRTAFLQYEFYDAQLIRHFVWTSCHNPDRRRAAHQCDFYDVYSCCCFVGISCHTQGRRTAFHQYEFYDHRRRSLWGTEARASSEFWSRRHAM